ncbi:ABC transporter ATP-binding protein [Halorussus salilacus]|uniref:ABC transporter ATP-binding protein n=1 Tax=Halorussus salilacus TaxID=2953750 RepID=UPI0020A140DF|nr:ABC transporter ATP-binding protein [Halorussus salilacus]USZ66738.1 ABC transporter ATP-binding protein [Halorussus salilacus]
MAAIETCSLTKRYGSLHAVRDVDLQVERGEVFGFLGPNGAGKSTTINVLLDFVRPTSGTVSVLGYDPQVESRAVRERVGVLPEASGYYDRNTAREHVEFAIEMKRSTDNVDAILERVGITKHADRPVGEFSKGMRQRLGLGIALVGQPDLIILDEPLGGLDPAGARLLREIVLTERDRGTTVFFSSHIMDQVEMLCDRVGIMNDGQLVVVDTVDQLRSVAERPDELVVSVDSVPEHHGIGSLDGVSNVVVQNETLRVSCADPTVKRDVIRRLEQAGATVVDIDNERPSLEQMFREITEAKVIT